MRQRRFRSRSGGGRHGGFSSVEVLTAVALLGTLTATIMPLFVRHGRLLVDTRQERLAIEELANQAERLAAAPAADREALLAALRPSDLAGRRLPGARIEAVRGPSPLGDRVVLKLSWDALGRRERPLVLAVWLPAAGGAK